MATARQLVEDAFEMAGIFKPTQTIAAQDAVFGIKTLNRTLQEYQNSGYFPFGSVVTNFSPPTVKQMYTIGIGGEINILGNPVSIQSVIVGGSEARYPLRQIPFLDFVAEDFFNNTACSFAFNRGAGLGEIWVNGEVSSMQITTAYAFADYGLDDQVSLPVGYFGLLVAEVASRCAPAYGVDPTFVKSEAIRMLDAIKRVNAGPPLMVTENPLSVGMRYDINTDTVY